MPQVAAIRRSTGRDREEWFRRLDAWGAAGRPYKEISEYLTGEHGVSRWWAQKIIVEYEQERGIRAPGVRRDGTFEVGASKTVAVPAERLFDAFVDPRRRRRWLSDGRMRLESSQPARSARFAWSDGTSRVTVEIEDKGPEKAMVVVSHQKLTDPERAAAEKGRWRDRLTDLKAWLEG